MCGGTINAIDAGGRTHQTELKPHTLSASFPASAKKASAGLRRRNEEACANRAPLEGLPAEAGICNQM